jgi:hypothetical protein
MHTVTIFFAPGVYYTLCRDTFHPGSSFLVFIMLSVQGASNGRQARHTQCYFTFGLFITTSTYTVPSNWIMVNNELERMWVKHLWSHSSWYLPGVNEENLEIVHVLAEIRNGRLPNINQEYQTLQPTCLSHLQ